MRGTFLYIIIGLMIGIACTKADAQGINSPPPSSPDKTMQKITVTGSYIKRAVSDSAPTPVVHFDGTKMEMMGSYTVANMLQESVIFNDVEDGEAISMHGQTEADNLVLLNGLRLPKTAGGNSVNIDFIPSSAVENVEVLKDGASALYGSEALAGVVNITTKKDFNGTNIYMRHSTPQILAKQESDVVLAHGRSYARSHFLIVGQFKKKTPLDYNQTIYGLSSLEESGSLESSPGNLNDINGDYHRSADCPQNQLDRQGRCRTDLTRYDQFRKIGSNREYYNLFLNAGYDISEKTKFDFVGIYTRQNSTSLRPPSTIQFVDETSYGGPDNSIPDTIANTWGTTNSATGAPSAPFTDNVDLHYLPAEELGRLKTKSTADNIVAQTRISTQWNSWDWELSSGYGNSLSNDKIVSGNADKQKLRDMITTGDFKPFNPKGTKSNLSSAFLQTWFKQSSSIFNTKLVGTGELFKMGQRPLMAAVGNEEQWQSFRFENDPYSIAGIPLTGQATNQNGSRRVDSAFVEFSHNPIEKLELQLAGRFDNYTDVGSTVNPKLGMAYHFNPNLTTRLSFGTGFKAPDLLSVFKGSSTQSYNIRDEVICAQNGESDPNCDDGVYRVTEVGNKNLHPEMANHFNVGMVLSPRSDVTLTIDYWHVSGRDALSEITLDEMTKAEKIYGPSLLNDINIQIQRDPTTHVIQSVKVPAKVNAGNFLIQGLDLSIEHKKQINPFGLGGMSLKLQMDHSHIMSSGYQEFAFRPFQKVGYLDWKNVVSAIIGKNNHMVRVAARTYAGMDKDDTLAGIGKGSSPNFTEYDLHYQIFTKWDGNFSFGIKNIFNRRPIANFRGIVEPANTNTNYLGRSFYIAYSQDI